MPDNNTPEFSVNPLTDKPKKKTARRSPTASRRARTTADKSKKVGEQLTAIYEDENGKLPNMNTIELKTGHRLLKKLFSFVIILGLLTAAAWTGFFLMPNQKSISAADVSLIISGERDLTLGTTTTITIAYQNNQKVALKNTTLAIRYPAGFTFLNSDPAANNDGNSEWRLGTLTPRQKGTVTIKGKVYAPLNTPESWRAFLTYQPENFQSELQTTATFENKIVLLPYTIKLTVPDKIQISADTNLLITVENTTADWPERLSVSPILPANFSLNSSTPKLNKNSWNIKQNISSSTPLTEFAIAINGQLSDQTEQTTTFGAQLFWLDDNNQKQMIAASEISAEIIKNSLNLSAAINGSTSRISSRPDDMLGITLNLKNTGADDVTNVQLKLILDAPSYQKQSVLDWANITDKYDGDVKGTQLSDTKRRGEIIWTSKHWPQLKTIKAGQEISLDLSLPVKDLKEISWDKIKEFAATLTAEVNFTNKEKDSASVISPIAIIFNSDLKAEVRDDLISSVNGADQHKITWVITNTLHPLKNVILSADIYGDTSLQLPDTAPAGKTNYDTTAKRLTWEIPEINDNMDILALPFTLTINKKDPTQNILMSKMRVQALDSVTGEELNLMADEIGLTAT